MSSTSNDPLARVIELDDAHVRRGLVIGVIGALLVHVAGASEAARLANGLGGWARETRSSVHDLFARLYEVEVVNAPPPPPPPEEKPEPETPKPQPAVFKPARLEPPPAPAQAGKILTQEPDPNAPVDLTGQGFVTGNAETYAGGVTASNGASTNAVHDLNAVPGGVPGGTGNKTAPLGPPGPGLSRSASIEGGAEWHCPFPPEANAEEINYQRVQIVVTVRPDGRPDAVRVIGDPGHGFGREARSCALRNRYAPALDREGHPTRGSILINVTFTRD